jgi:hypothetical protein
VTYDTYGPRTRFAICWMLALLATPALALAVARWSRSGQLRDAIGVLWVVAVAAATIRLLLRLGRLERGRHEPDAGMHLAFEAIALIPLLGLIPLLVSSAVGSM